MDGSYSATLDIRVPRADAIVWFDCRADCVPRACGASPELRPSAA